MKTFNEFVKENLFFAPLVKTAPHKTHGTAEDQIDWWESKIDQLEGQLKNEKVNTVHDGHFQKVPAKVAIEMIKKTIQNLRKHNDDLGLEVHI